LQETNVKGTFLTTQSFIRNNGGEGTIINLVSTGVALQVPGISSYASSKLAVIKLGQSLSLGESKLPPSKKSSALIWSDPEYPKIRAFSVHPGVVEATDRGMVVDAFTPFAKDKQSLTGGVSLWLSTPKADFLKGGFLTVNCMSFM
jgi:NAD(P)-dependent dehydrogenase (short-subunit alcohol dehydrogenase family)